jgi:hypothetical protein
MQDWVGVVQRKGKDATMLVADSYYIDGASRANMLESGVKFLCASSSQRFRDLVSQIKVKVTKPGEWGAMWKENSGELFVHVWDENEAIGKKYVLTNAFTKQTSGGGIHKQPAYDEYSIMFSLCDRFNSKLHDCTFPHKKGGRNRRGEEQTLNDFYFSSILQNVFSAYIDLGGMDTDFKTHCTILADELYQLASTLDVV